MKFTKSSRSTAKGPADWFTADEMGNPVTWLEHVTDDEYPGTIS